MLRMENIKMQGGRSLNGSNLDGLKVEVENAKINYLTETDIILIINTICMIINIWLIITIVNCCANYEKLTDKVQVLERFIKENKKSIQTQTEEFKQEPTATCHDGTQEGWSKVSRKPSLVIQLLQRNKKTTQGYAEVKWNLMEIFDFRTFKKMVILYSVPLLYWSRC